MKITKKHIIIVLPIPILGLGGFLFLKPVELSLYSTPIVLNEVFSDGTTGVWEGVEYMQHDCNGCETKNHHILSLTSDSSGIITQKIVHFRVLLRPPFGRLVYGYSKNVGSINSTKVGIRGKCLVFFNSESNYTGDIIIPDSAALDHFNNYYKYNGCNIKPNEFPTEVFRIEFLPDKVILTP